MLNQWEIDREERYLRGLRQENGFCFNGLKSKDFHLYVEKYPKRRIPRKRVDTVHIPGRSGDLHLKRQKPEYENYIQPYECYFHSYEPVPEAAAAIAEWLIAPDGYCDLWDYYSAGVRHAMFRGPMNIENTLNQFGRCVVEFNCAPQNYRRDLKDEVTHDVPFVVYGNAFPAAPLITVYGEGPGNLMVGDTKVQILKLHESLTLDCDLQDAYKEEGGVQVNHNADIYAPEFPIIQGETRVSWDGGITKVELKARYWTL